MIYLRSTTSTPAGSGEASQIRTRWVFLGWTNILEPVTAVVKSSSPIELCCEKAVVYSGAVNQQVAKSLPTTHGLSFSRIHLRSDHDRRFAKSDGLKRCGLSNLAEIQNGRTKMVSPMRASPESKPAEFRETWQLVFLYYAIACGWAWLAWSPVVLGSDGLKVVHVSAPFPLFSCIATLGPLLGCFIAHRRKTGTWRAVHFLPARTGRWPWLILGPMLVLSAFFLVFPAFVSTGNPTHWHWHPAVLIGFWVPMLNYNLFGGPLFEEFGWRGFLQVHLQEIMPPWVAAICVGVMWALWHAPLFLLTWSSSSPSTYILILVGLSILMAYVFNSSGCAVTVAILMHSAFNASSRFLGPFLGDTPARQHPSPETLIAFAFLTLALLPVLFTRGRLNAQAAPQAAR
jgi:membrane protease YdiL (CAAX protease family)